MNTPQRRALGALFFLYAFGLISWVPRFPEIKHNLGISNGQFGTLMSFGAVGSIISLLTVGEIVNRFGSRKVITASATVLFGSMATVVHLRSTWQFLICIIVIGLGTSALHTSINGQALHEQAPNENLMGRLHGLWSLGALTASIVSGLLAGRVSLILHIDGLLGLDYLVILYLINVLQPTLLLPSIKRGTPFSAKSIFTSFNLDWKMALGFTSAVALEFAVGDWGAIFSKEELHMSSGVSAIPYVLFVFTMIVGRFAIHRLTSRRGLAHLIKRFVIIGGSSFIFCDLVGVQISKTAPLLGFVIVAVGSFVGGLGASFLAPTIMDAANRRSKSSGSVVVGQLGVINTSLIFVLKTIIAWTAQFTSISVALVIPAALLISVSLVAKTIENAHA